MGICTLILKHDSVSSFFHPIVDTRKEANMNTEDIVQQSQTLITLYGIKVISALLIIVLGLWLTKKLTGVARRLMLARNLETTLVSFVSNLLYSALAVFVVLAALSKLGIQTASFVAVLAAAGLAVGLALQGSLSNFAAGVLMVLFKPFKVGDYIEAGGASGIVQEIMIFSTQLCTVDNKRVIIPNATIMGGNIVNYSANSTRRVDLTIGVSYDASIKEVRRVLESVLVEHPLVLQDQEKTVAVSELADSSVNFVVRCWVETENYWTVYFELTESIKLQLDANNINIPYPQLDLHIDSTSQDSETYIRRVLGSVTEPNVS